MSNNQPPEYPNDHKDAEDWAKDASGGARRNNVPLMTPAEYAIYEAVHKVEEIGAHPLLTDAVNLLQQARDKVADFVELPKDSPLTPFGEALNLLRAVEMAISQCPLREDITAFRKRFP